MAKKNENFLDYVPKRNSLMNWEVNEKKRVVVHVENRGMFNRIAQVIFRRPKVSKIELDELGSFVWQSMDGVKTVYDSGSEVKEAFGEKAEPVYERLCEYIQILRNNSYIVYENKK